MTTSELIEKVWDEIKTNYDSLTNKPNIPLKLEDVVKLSKEIGYKIGVYIIYDEKGDETYAGSTKDICGRLIGLLKFNHTFSWRLLKDRIHKRIGKYPSGNWVEEHWGETVVKGSKDEVEKILDKYSFKYAIVEGHGSEERNLARALLLEHFVIVLLEPDFNMKALKERKRGEI
jgi:hypothetical protein